MRQLSSTPPTRVNRQTHLINKSMQPMAERLGVDHQQLQQFVSSSTWDHVEVRRRLAQWATGFVEPGALVIDDTGFPADS
jgi:SRSO17 transposase